MIGERFYQFIVGVEFYLYHGSLDRGKAQMR
jgi:hypothetical protein